MHLSEFLYPQPLPFWFSQLLVQQRLSLFVCPIMKHGVVDLRHYFDVTAFGASFTGDFRLLNHSAILAKICPTKLQEEGCTLYLQCQITKTVVGFLIAKELQANGWAEVGMLASLKAIFRQTQLSGFMGMKLGSLLLTAFSFILRCKYDQAQGYYLVPLPSSRSFYEKLGMQRDFLGKVIAFKGSFFSPCLPFPGYPYYKELLKKTLAMNTRDQAALVMQRVWRSKKLLAASLENVSASSLGSWLIPDREK